MLKCMQSGYMNLPERADGSVIQCARAGGRRRGGKFGWRAYFAHRAAGAGLPVQLLSIYVASQTQLIAAGTRPGAQNTVIVSKGFHLLLILITF
jgi:hypothetical protein